MTFDVSDSDFETRVRMSFTRQGLNAAIGGNAWTRRYRKRRD
jgi:hypothetical protein